VSDFFQDGPQLGNQYDDDPLFRELIARTLPDDVFAAIEPGLRRLGDRAVGDLWDWAVDAETNPPRLVQFSPWGQRVDRIEVSQGWEQLGALAGEEEMVALAHERPYGEYSRVVQFAKLHLFHPSSSIYTCPIAMSDGAARVLDLYATPELRERAIPRLLSRDPATRWTSGQWMTERSGGSDLSGTETVARRDGDQYKLYGHKWFTSATTSQMAITLARIEDENGDTVPGSKGLSVFYLETHLADGQLNGITIHRLKDKMGSKGLPTAEVTLDGARAELVGAPGRGIPIIASQFNITRVHNSIVAASSMRRMVALVRDYSSRRKAFGRPLIELPLFSEVLSGLEVEARGSLHLVVHLVHMLGKEEAGTASADESAMLRLLMPLAKLYTAKQAIAVAAEGLEAFGGAGFVEDTGLPRHLPDSLALAIWEGATNVLALDSLRAIVKDGALEPLLADLDARLAAVTAPGLIESARRVQQAVSDARTYVDKALSGDQDEAEAVGREIAYSLTRITVASLMLEHAGWAIANGDGPVALAAARRWCDKPLAPVLQRTLEAREESRLLTGAS